MPFSKLDYRKNFQNGFEGLLFNFHIYLEIMILPDGHSEKPYESQLAIGQTLVWVFPTNLKSQTWKNKNMSK